ncbi:MAG: VPLPA-CTERM sorting domain-containing protein [Candidatus Thiodiazotropha sp.]
MNRKNFASCAGILLFGLSVTVQASLFDRGNGMIYDSDQNLTWLQDANYAQTSGYVTHGAMSWHESMGWVDGLIFGGYEDWRLPTVIDTGTPGSNPSYAGSDAGFNVDTSTSELAYMFHVNLSNESFYNPDGSQNTDGCSIMSPWCRQNTSADGVSILNLQSDNYWSGTASATNTDFAWSFGNSRGHQGEFPKGFLDFAWAVRDGDVAVSSVPVPSALVLMLSGLAGLGVVRRKQTSLYK